MLIYLPRNDRPCWFRLSPLFVGVVSLLLLGTAVSVGSFGFSVLLLRFCSGAMLISLPSSSFRCLWRSGSGVTHGVEDLLFSMARNDTNDRLL